MRALRFAVVGGILLSVSAIGASQVLGVSAARPLRVCDALSNLDLYRGKMIAIVGFLDGGRRHGLTLNNNSGAVGMCPNVTKLGYTWPAAIALSQYTEGSDIEDGPARFESQSVEIDSKLSEPMRLASASPSYVVETVLVGELRSRKGIEIRRDESGWFVGTGYAQNGQYPAMLVIYTVRSARVVLRR